MKVFDLHSDLFTDIAWRRSKGETRVFDRFHYPKLRRGLVEAVICVFWTERQFRGDPYGRFQFLYHHVMADLLESEHAYICRTAADLETSSRKVKIILGLEGLSFIEGWQGVSKEEKVLNAFEALNANGFRHAILSWNEQNFLASGTGIGHTDVEKGLTEHGKSAIQLMESERWMIDVSHMDEASFNGIVQMTEGPIFASHSNAKTVCDNERNLSDEQLRTIARSGGIIGLNAYYEFIDPDNPTIDRLIDHAIYIADLVGTDHLSFGFDFIDFLQPYGSLDGVTGSTGGLETVEQVPALIEKLRKRGFSEMELNDICYGNAFRFVKHHMQ
ncbi:dipeptidase [Sporosarcina contaminans]|uniref:Dipeptidase n=1 Tax=Sporosarcina contaminans TaxID=633403 RepID=A0ABW3TXW4_9BACL